MGDSSGLGVTQHEKVELAKALLAVRSIASAADFQKVRDILVPDTARVEVDRTIQGLSKEDEFALMCRLMGTATHLVPLEQRPVIAGDYLVPDFMARFQPSYTPLGKSKQDSQGFRCFVEVKSTQKDSYKVGGQRLSRLRAFADQFDLPLLFAIRFLRFGHYAMWALVEDDRNATALTFDYTHVFTGVRNVLWNDYFFRVNPWITFRHVFDTADADPTTFHDKARGKLREFHIISDPTHPIHGEGVVDNTAVFADLDAATFYIFFDCFDLDELEVDKRGTRTVSISEATMPCTVVDAIYRMNCLPRDEHGQVIFDPSRVLAAGLDGPPITRLFVDNLVRVLGRVTLHTVAYDFPEDQLARWRRVGGV